MQTLLMVHPFFLVPADRRFALLLALAAIALGVLIVRLSCSLLQES